MFLVYFLAFSPYSPFTATTLGGTATPTTKTSSTITLIDYASGEDVSSWVEISLWLPAEDDTEFDDADDPYRLSNFDEDVQSRHADDISEDLREHEYAWLEIDPDDRTFFGGYATVTGGITANTDDFRPLIGGANYDYTFYVYHVPENVTINILDWGDSGNDNALGNSPAGGDGLDEWGGAENGNFTIFLDVPQADASELHFGTVGSAEWNIETEDYNDMDEDEKAWLIDQRNWRTIAPFYDIADDTDKDFNDEFERLTNVFGVRFSFNDTVSQTDGAVNQVNITLVERDFDAYDAEVVYGSNNSIYIFWHEAFSYKDGFNIDIEIQMGSGINASGDVNSAVIPTYGVSSGRMTVPGDTSPLGTFTVLDNAPLGFD